MAEGGRLFSKVDTYTVIQDHEQAIFKEVGEMAPNQLLNTSIDDLCNYLEDRYRLDVPELQENGITVDQEDTKVDLAQYSGYVVRGASTYVPATAITFYVPFSGDGDLFVVRPSTYSLNLPRGEVTPAALILCYTTTNHNAEDIQGQFNAGLASIKKHLAQLHADAYSFNASLRLK
jgi:hypothetical protein